VRRNKRRVIAALAVGALVLAGSAAFTDALITTDVGTNQCATGAPGGCTGNFVGYGTVTVTQGHLESISYTELSAADPPVVEQVTLEMLDNTTDQTAYIGFDTTNGDTGNVKCAAGTYGTANPADPNAATDTQYICTIPGGFDLTADIVNTTEVALANT